MPPSSNTNQSGSGGSQSGRKFNWTAAGPIALVTVWSLGLIINGVLFLDVAKLQSDQQYVTFVWEWFFNHIGPPFMTVITSFAAGANKKKAALSASWIVITTSLSVIYLICVGAAIKAFIKSFHNQPQSDAYSDTFLSDIFQLLRRYDIPLAFLLSAVIGLLGIYFVISNHNEVRRG